MIITSSAGAITAEDVTKRMNQEQRINYLQGLIDMLAYQTAAGGDKARSSCIIEMFYRSGKKTGWTRLLDILEGYADKRPEILVSVLAKQLCKGK